jgi:hypothetical protein
VERRVPRASPAGIDEVKKRGKIMLFQKKNPSVRALGFFKSKHKDSTPVVSRTLAQADHQSNSDTSVSLNKVLLTGVDSLVITLGGNVAPSSWLKEHQSIWKEYQEQHSQSPDDKQYITDEINGEWWCVKPYGIGHYKYVLDNPEIGHLRVWNVDKWSSASRTKQHIYFDLRSSWLHKRTPQQLHNDIVEMLGGFFEFHDPSELNIQITRIDLHSDISNGSTFLTHAQVDNSISRSKYRERFNGDDTIKLTSKEKDFLKGGQSYNKSPQKLMSNEEVQSLFKKVLQMEQHQNSYGVDSMVHKRDIESVYYGKRGGDIWGKIYDKTKCVKTKSDNDTPLLWIENGWNKTDTIIRTEFSMRRAFIKELDNGSYVLLSDFIKNISSIWEWVTSKWLRLVDKINRNNIQTSPISQFWLVVQLSFKNATNNIIRKRNFHGKVNQLIKQGLGCLQQAAAKGMNSNEDYRFPNAIGEAVKKVLSSSYHSGELLERRLVLGLT